MAAFSSTPCLHPTQVRVPRSLTPTKPPGRTPAFDVGPTSRLGVTTITSRLCAPDYARAYRERDHPCMALIAYFREKAAQYRRLAENIIGDPTAEALLRLAEEFDAKAAACDARQRAALAIGVGDGVAPVKPTRARRRKKK